MKNRIVLAIILGMIVIQAGMAEEKSTPTESKKDAEAKLSRGIQFSVPEDWPIEKRNGAVGPIPIEEYLAIKFKKLEDRITILENKVNHQSSADTNKSAAKNTNRFQSYEQKPADALGEDRVHEQAS